MRIPPVLVIHSINSEMAKSLWMVRTVSSDTILLIDLRPIDSMIFVPFGFELATIATL